MKRAIPRPNAKVPNRGRQAEALREDQIGENSDDDERTQSQASTIESELSEQEREYEYDELAFENGWEDLEEIPDPLDDEDEQDDVGVPVRLTAETTTLPMPHLSKDT